MPICRPIKRATKLMQLYHVQSILEVGCGKGGILAQFHAPLRIGVDNFEPFLIYAKQTFPGPIFMKFDVRNLRDIFLEKSFDAVIGFDILEHLSEKDMLDLIQVCEEFARKLVIFFSPLDEKGLEIEPEAVEENPGMAHLTIIRAKIFNDKSYQVFLYPGYHKNGVTAMLAIKEL